MIHHHFYKDAVTLLSIMENTTPEILLQVNPETLEGIAVRHKLRVICNFCECLYNRGARDNTPPMTLTNSTGSDYGVRGIGRPTP